MTNIPNNTKKEKYTLKQINQVIKDIYEVESHGDDWGVPVVYYPKMKEQMRKRLKKIKQYIK